MIGEQFDNMQADGMHLIFCGKKLDNNKKSLEECDIENRSTIYPIFRLRGGGGYYSPIKFNNMEKQIIGKFTSTAPAWRILNPGISFEGKCTKEDC